VLLHGFLGSGTNLRPLAVRWAERAPDRRFLLPDLVGHGTSPPLPPDPELDGAARAVLETAARAGVGPRLTLVGHSMGGRVALAAARVAPAALEEVVLLDIAPGPIDQRRAPTRGVLEALLAAPDTAPDRRTMREALLGRGLSPGLSDWLVMNVEPRGDGVAWRIDRRALEGLHDRFSSEDLWPIVESRPVPMRAIRGGRSGYVSDADAARLRAAGCPVETLPEAGHYVHVDALDALVELLRS
jgi:pimeloyl-ACP methyl ester carboxylesterase